MHDELRQYAAVLANEDHLKRLWSEGDQTSPSISSDQIVHFFFDDTNLSKNPEGCIGWYLRNQREAEEVRLVVRALDAVMEEVEPSTCDRNYVNAANWPLVVAAAKSLLAAMDSEATAEGEGSGGVGEPGS